MKKLKLFPILLVLLIVISLSVGLYSFAQYQQLRQRTENLTNTVDSIQADQSNFKANFEDELFEDHLKLQQQEAAYAELVDLQNQLEALNSTKQGTLAQQVNLVYSLYSNFLSKYKRNESVKLDVTASKSATAEWGNMLLEQQFDDLSTKITEQNSTLDAAYKKYADELAASAPPPAAVSADGYSFVNITTEKGTRHGVYLIKMPLSQVRVKTIAAIEDDCKDNCPTKSLEQYVKENNGIAGMNGTYFCPPDYSACDGKVNSFDYAFYDSNDHKWFNRKALSWSDTGMFTFSGHSYNFYKKTSEYGGGSVEAALSNYPSLLKNEEVVVDDDILTSFQKTRGLRGAIGMGGENIYLAQITNASVEEAAYVMKALGAKHALNLDGGGSAAMYINGRYVLGPGRSLANAIVLVR
jgi:exopolysaccharide biosynthesis protein